MPVDFATTQDQSSAGSPIPPEADIGCDTCVPRVDHNYHYPGQLLAESAELSKALLVALGADSAQELLEEISLD